MQIWWFARECLPEAEEGVALLEDLCHWYWDSGFNSLVSFLMCFLPPACSWRCELLAVTAATTDSNPLAAKAQINFSF